MRPVLGFAGIARAVAAARPLHAACLCVVLGAALVGASLAFSFHAPALADESLGAPFLGPDGEVRLLIRPEFRDAPGLLEDVKRFQVEGLRVDLVGPYVPVPPVPGKPPPPPVPSRLLVQGKAEAVARGREILHYLDVPRPAVLVSLLAAETRCETNRESGGSVSFDRRAGADVADTIFRGFASEYEPDAFLRATLTGARPFEGTSLYLGDGGYEQVFRMLEARREAEFLAWPSILVTEGEAGSIGSTVLIPQTLFQRTNDTRVITSRGEETGIKLEVRPVSVGHEEAVLDLAAWIRVAEPSAAPDAAPGAQILRSRKVTTRVTVRDRESLVIGGLKIRRTLTARRGLPGLQHLPVVDPLVSARRGDVEEVEVVFLVRARIRIPGRSSGPYLPPAETARLQDALKR